MQIEITDRHAEVISRACEILSRLHMGQMSIVLHEVFRETEPEDRASVCLAFHRVMPEGRGITSRNIREEAKIAFEIHQLLRQNLAIRRNGGKANPMFVCYDSPLKTSQEPLPTITGHAELVAAAKVNP
jgi:hypothetical protein